MAAAAGAADNINKQARKMRTNWVNSPERANWVNAVKNKQTANGFLRWPQSVGLWVPVPPSSADGPLHPSCTDHVCTYRSCGGIAC